MAEFDPSQPYDVVDETAPEFDPSQPFEEASPTPSAAPRSEVAENVGASDQMTVPFPGQSSPSPARPPNAIERSLESDRNINAFRDEQQLRQQQEDFTPEELRRVNEGTLAENIMSPLPGVAAPMITKEDVLRKFPHMTTGNAGIIAGVMQTAAGAYNFGASPLGLATLPVAAMSGAPGLAGLAGKAVLGSFSVEAIHAMPAAIDAMNDALNSGDPERIAQTGTQLGLNMAVALGAGKQAFGEPLKVSPEAKKILPMVERAKASGMTESARALEQVAVESSPKPKPVADQSLGVMPPGGDFIPKVVEYFTPPDAAAIPEIKIEHGARLPRLQPYETEKLLASSPEGMARVPVLGALMDPRATAKAAPDAPIITRAYSVHKGRTFAAMWGESQVRYRDIFKAEKDGTISLTNGERGYMSDVIEAEMRDPGSQAITERQRKWINEEWIPLREDAVKMLKEEGVKEVVTEDMEFGVNDYFPRPAIGKRNRPEAQARGGGSRPGAAPFFEKSRKYKTEFEGARPSEGGTLKEEIIYDPDAISRSMKFIMGTYRAVADHRLANDAALGGKTVTERFGELKEKHGDALSILDDAEKVEFESQLREQAAYPVWGKEEALNIAPAFQGKIYPVETAKKLRAAYAQESNAWVQGLSTMTGAAKAMMATADMSGPMIQGAAMMFRHPMRWAKATANSYRSLLDPATMGKMLEQERYKKAAEEFTQSGGSLLQLEDFLSGMRPDSPATKIPVAGSVIKATGRAYGVFLDLAKLEMWEAHTKGVPKSEWGRVAETIENSLFMGRMESAGLNPSRAVGERLLAFAPIYYRGASGLIATAFQKGVTGSIARQMIGSYAAGGTLLTVGALLALDHSWDEIEERLDPRSAKFIKVPVDTADGKRVEVGVGNVLSQLVRLGAQAADYHTNEKPIDTGVEGNPYLRFLRGRAAFIPSLAIELSTGRDYFGNRIEAKESVARRFMPFALQAMFPREPEAMSTRLMDTGFSFFGLNAFPESEYATQLRHLDESIKEKKGVGFYDLPLNERAVAAKEFKERADYKKREPTIRDMERFVHINEQRERSVNQKLDESTRKKLAELGLAAGGYKSTVSYKGVDVPLSKDEQLRYEELLVEEYDAQVKAMPEAMASLPPSKRDEWWSKYRQQIGETARKRLMIEMQESGQPAKVTAPR